MSIFNYSTTGSCGSIDSAGMLCGGSRPITPAFPQVSESAPSLMSLSPSTVIIIIVIIITISRYLAPPSSTNRPTRTDSKPRHCHPSPLAVPCSKETGDSKFSNFPGKKTAGDANFWLKKNPPENQSLRHNSRPDLTYRAPSPAGSFYQVTSTLLQKRYQYVLPIRHSRFNLK